MNAKPLFCLLAFVCGLAFVSRLLAQTPGLNCPCQPRGTLKQRVGLTNIQVDFSRPGVKDRTNFGGIVPYGQVWRTGANDATRLTFSTPVKLEGHEIPAGTYALFTIPGESEWTIIINKNAKHEEGLRRNWGLRLQEMQEERRDVETGRRRCNPGRKRQADGSG